MWSLLDVVGRVAKRRETTHAAVSLAWLLARPETSSIIVGARTVKQLEENLKALDVKLSAEDVKELDDASKPAWDYPYEFIARLGPGETSGRERANVARVIWLDDAQRVRAKHGTVPAGVASERA
jgi:hypothetical protein